MRIAVFDYRVTPKNAIGKCHLAVLSALCNEHEFTVFAPEFENPCPERIQWVRVPCFIRPMFLLFLTFHLLAPLAYCWYRFSRHKKFDVVQFVESNLLFGDIAYSHFCHRAFLKLQWRSAHASGLRGTLRWMDHFLHAAIEPWAYRRARRIVVPSKGLARELQGEYPYVNSKIVLQPNPVDVCEMARPNGFDVDGFRRQLGFASGDLVLVFIALGHYERKGLPLLLDALAMCRDTRLKLAVVGGTSDLVKLYSERASRMALAGQVIFVGSQRDVRPYLWCASAFVLPSYYEVFPLVVLEAAAAGAPLIVTALNGVEEFLRDGENGLLIKKRNSSALAADLVRFSSLSAESRKRLAVSAQRDIAHYALPSFVHAWSRIYGGV